jgi:hypothetical protein
MAPPWERTLKKSDDAVKKKLWAFATQNLLKRGERLGGVIQNRENSQDLPTELATMVWKLDSMRSKNSAPGEGYGAPACFWLREGFIPDVPLSEPPRGRLVLPERGGKASAAGGPGAGAPSAEGAAALRGRAGRARGSWRWVAGWRRLRGRDPRVSTAVVEVGWASSGGGSPGGARELSILSTPVQSKSFLNGFENENVDYQ